MRAWRAALLSAIAGLGVNVQIVNAQTSLKATVFGNEVSFPVPVKYAGNRHTNGKEITYADGGKEAILKGNIWQAFKFPTAITIDKETVLKFRVETAANECAEINAICLDENLNLDNNARRCFAFAGREDIDNNRHFNKLSYTDMGGVKEYEVPVGVYFTSANVNYIALIQDNNTNRNGGLNKIKNIEIKKDANAVPKLTLTVNGQEVTSQPQVAYDQNQHTVDNLVEFNANGKEATLKGNIWVAFEVPEFEVSTTTLLKFRFESTKAAEINAVCVDENLEFSDGKRCFMVGGTENVHTRHINKMDPFTAEGGANDYEISMGQYFQTTAKYIIFIQDNDAKRYDGLSSIKNVEIAAGASFQANVAGQNVNAPEFVRYGGNQDTPSNQYDISDGGNTITFNGNMWRAFPVDIEITKNTVLSFEFEVIQEAEVNAICLDEDTTYGRQNGARCIAFGGTQDVSKDANFYLLPNYTGEGEKTHYLFRPADYFQTQVNYVALMQDRDDNKQLGRSSYSNIQFLEPAPSCIATADFDFTLTECNYENVLQKLQEVYNSRGSSCTNSFMVDVFAFFDGSVSEGIGKLCGSTYDIDAVAFGEVMLEGDQFDAEYFDGGTTLNYERKLVQNSVEEGVLSKDGGRIKYIFDNFAQKTPISWADSHNLQGCKLRAAMCCFVADRQANDNNGNCADNDCADADPADNADLCYVDMSRSQRSAHVRDGYSIYGNGVEGGFHCHGFAWGDNSGKEDVLKGNNLFYVSMYDHLYTRGYVEEVQGAPMCGCVEQMPVVTRADCTQVDVTQSVKVVYKSEITNLYATADITNIDFNSCQGADNTNNDLSAYYQKLVNDGKASQFEKDQLDKYLVGAGNCQAAIDGFLNSKNLKRA